MTRAFMRAAVPASRVASYDATDLGGSSLRCSGGTCRAQIFLIYPASRPFAAPWLPSCGCNSAGCTSPFRHVAVPLCSYRGDLQFASQKGFQPVMKIFRLMACAAIAGLVATAAHAGADGRDDRSIGRKRCRRGTCIHCSCPIWLRALDTDRAWRPRLAWRFARRLVWPARMVRRPPGTPRNWHSGWGGGWYGGWYQPYWGQGWWASPNWAYGSEHYYGHYPAPNACGSGGCAQPAPEYVPLK